MSTMWGEDPAAIRERIREQIAAAEEHARAAERFAAMVESARSRGRDQRREVEVEVDSVGHLLSVRLEDPILDRRVEDIESAILDAYGAAVRSMSEDIAERTRETFGEDTETSKQLLSAFNGGLERHGGGER